MQIDKPEPGYYRTRLRSRGPWVPAIIWEEPARDPATGQLMDRAPHLRCMVNGAEREVDDVWTRLHPIEAAVYEQLCADRDGLDDDHDHRNSPPRI